MGVTKTDIFTKKQNDIANLAKALGHPARIAILEYLSKTNNCVCGDLVLSTGLAQATVSQHLKELKNVGLITGTIEGPSTCYCIDSDKWREVKDKFEILFEAFDIEDCC